MAFESQINSKLQFEMTKQILYRTWVIVIYLIAALPARSLALRAGGRCLGLGACSLAILFAPC